MLSKIGCNGQPPQLLIFTFCLLWPLSALVLAPLPGESHSDADVANALQRTSKIADFLRQHIYGRSRVLPLSQLLQRQFRPVPPLPFRRDSLLINQPDWFESRLDELERTLQQLEDDMDEQEDDGVAVEEDADE